MPKNPARPKTKKKEHRAPRGTGTVFEKCPGLWVARKPIGKRRGRTVYLERTGKSQAEAIRRRDGALPPDPRATTVAAWADRWLASADVREQTRDDYRVTIDRRLKPSLGPRLISAVTAYDVERAATEWGRAPGGAAANTVRKYMQHVRTLFGAAVRAGLRPDNPAASARKPKATKVEIDPFTSEELAAIVRAAVADPSLARVAVMAAIGCRPGEACALDPTDYDPATGELSISRTLTVRHGTGPTKSANSTRTVRVPKPARPAALALGPGFTHVTLARRWYLLLDRLKLRRRNPHQARHSVATLAIAANVPLANVARDLGDTVDTIVRTYLHPTPGADVCSAMEGLLGGDKVATDSGNVLERPRKQARGVRAN